nr:hypothetical protein 23 [bacterium]
MIPLSLKIRNFFSHKETEVDFTKFNSALLIGNVEGDYNISNGSGKSAIFEAVLWCLFNKARTAAIDDIIMWNETNCHVAFEFLHHGERYRVVRTRSRTTGTSTVEFYVEDEGAWRDKSGSTARLTNDEIVSVIRVDYKTFINSAYFRQNDISEFAESDAGRKKDILKSIIDLSRWDEYERSVKGAVKALKQECALLAAESNELTEAKEELVTSKLKFQELSRLVEIKGAERDALGQKIETLGEKYSALKQSLDTDQWDKVTEENARLAKGLKTLMDKRASLINEISEYEKQIKTISEQIAKSQEIISSLKFDEEANDKLSETRAEKNRYEAEISGSKERLLELDQINISSGTCYICGQSVSDELSHKLHHDHEEKVESFKKKIIYGKNRINQLNAEVTTLEQAVRDNQKLTSMKATMSANKSKLQMLSGHLERISGEAKDVTKSILESQNKIKGNESVLESLRNEDFNNLRIQIKEMKAKRVVVQSELETINRDVGIFSQKVINLQEKIGKMTESQKTLLEKKQNLIVNEKFAKLLGKNGIQTILLNAVIEDLEVTSNDILTSICNEPFQIILETQRLGSDGVSIVDTLDLKVKKDGIVQNFKSLSGGEQFRISLALRIALSEISSKHGGSSLDFLLLDEINSPLDRHGTENLFVNVIKSLEDNYKILVITHDDLLKERFDHVLDVTKVNGESSVKFISK